MKFRVKNMGDERKLKKLYEANVGDLKLFYSNVEYLRGLRGWTRERAIIELREQTGWVTCGQSVRLFLRGSYSESSFSVLKAWSLLFGESVGSLLSRDYRAEASVAA